MKYIEKEFTMSQETNVTKNTTPNRKIGDLTIPEEAFYTVFEPRTPNRFLVYIEDENTKKLIIEPFLIKYIDRPRYSLKSDKTKHWYPIKVRFYESIVPSNVYFRLLKAGVFNITVNELGPVGDIVGIWLLPLCRFNSLIPEALDWSSDGKPLEVWAEIDWTEVIVKDSDSEFKIRK